MNLNERIRYLREYLGMNQERFAEKLGLTKSAISGYETGRREPPSHVLKSICRTFQVQERWLLEGFGEIEEPDAESTMDEFCDFFSCSKFEREMLMAYFSLTEDSRREFCRTVYHVFAPAFKNLAENDTNPMSNWRTENLPSNSEFPFLPIENENSESNSNTETIVDADISNLPTTASEILTLSDEDADALGRAYAEELKKKRNLMEQSEASLEGA